MIDIHAHVLPGIDDGAETMEEAVAMCRKAARDGCEAVLATPHQRHSRWWNSDSGELARLRRRLQEAVGPAPRILAGAEVRVDGGLLDAVRNVGVSGVQPLAGSRHLLVEFGRDGMGPPPEQIVHELSVAGWWPILAHPELLPWLGGDLPRLEHLVDLGARLQVTAMSITGEFGRRPRESVRQILDAGLAHFVASDMHGVERRPPGLSRAAKALRKGWGEDTARRLTYENPARVTADEAVAP